MVRRNTVGVIGLGRMGGPVAQRFMQSEFPLMVWDILPGCCEPFENKDNVRIAHSGEMARECSIIFFVVPSSAEIAHCFKGKDGILQNARKGLILCDLTTSDPVETRKLASRAAGRGVHYLDAGMSGGPAGILAGKLTLMIGGDAEVLRRTKPYLAPFVENIFHLGSLGSGHAMKLIHNMVLHTIFLATCEGARVAERMGMQVTDMIDVFNVSTAFSYASRHRFPNNILNGSWNAQARIYNPYKDVGLAVRLARECGAGVELGEWTLDFLEKAVARGMVEEDYSLLYRDFDEILKTGAEEGNHEMTYPEIARFHGHECPGLAVGYRMACAAMDELHSFRAEDEELVAIVENDACGVDALQCVSGCTFGKGNLIFRDYGKQVYTLYSRSGQTGVRVVFHGNGISDEVRKDRAVLAQWILKAPKDSIVSVTRVPLEAPEPAKVRTSVPCTFCGELVMESRLKQRDGNPACIPCSELPFGS